MADDVMGKAAADARAGPGERSRARCRRATPSRAERARRDRYRSRFAAFYVVLAIVAGVGVGALLVLVGRGSPRPLPPGRRGSRPEAPSGASAQIGDHVGDQYRLPSGKPLVAVTYAGPPTVTGPGRIDFQVRAIAVRPDTTGGRAEADDIDTVNAAEHGHVHALRARYALLDRGG